MRIEKVKIKNYKLFQDFTMLFNDDLNIMNFTLLLPELGKRQ